MWREGEDCVKRVRSCEEEGEEERGREEGARPVYGRGGDSP